MGARQMDMLMNRQLTRGRRNQAEKQMIMRTFLISVCLITLVWTSFLVIQYVGSRNQIIETNRILAQKETFQASQRLNDSLKRSASFAQSIAEDLKTGDLGHDGIIERLNRAIGECPDIYGIGVAYIPYMDSTEKRDSPYYIRRNKNSAINEKGIVQAIKIPLFSEDPESGNRISTGMVFVDYTYDDIRKIISTRSLGNTGYSFILSQKGIFIYHPIEEYFSKSKSIFTIAETTGDRRLQYVAGNVVSGDMGIIDYDNEITGQSSWISYAPVPSAGWFLAAVFVKNELLRKLEDLSRQKIWISLSGSPFVFLLLAIILNAKSNGNQRLWIISICVSILLLSNIVYILYFTTVTPEKDNPEHIKILDKAGLDKFIKNWIQPKETGENKTSTVTVPTGIFIESLQFTDLNNVLVSGYIWQKYTDDRSGVTTSDIIFPNSISSKIEKAYEQIDSGMKSVGWRFNIVLRQRFDYSKYPFDRVAINIPIRFEGFVQDMLFIPDLDSYNLINPTSKPGISHDLVLPGWEIESSAFNYKVQKFLTDFGVTENVWQQGFPDLRFTIKARRHFLIPCISSLLPVLIVNCIAFGMLLMVSKTEKADKVYGLKTSGVLATCSGLFFGVLLGHVKLRARMNFEDFFYMEYIYFLCYFSILVIAVNSLLFGISKGFGWVHYRDNIIPKILYWPVVQFALLVITLLIFMK